MVFPAYTARVLVIDKAVTLHGRMERWGSWSRVLLDSLVVADLRILKGVVSLPQRHAFLRLLVPLFHLLLVEFDGVTSVNNRPLHSHVFGRKIRVGSEPKGSLVKGVIPLLGLLTTTVPCLICRLELLLNDWRTVSALRSVSVDVNVAHSVSGREGEKINFILFVIKI